MHFSPHSLTATADTLDAKCEELNKQLADAHRQCSTLQRKNEKLLQERLDAAKEADVRGSLRPLRPVDSFYEADDAAAAAAAANGVHHSLSGPESMAFAFRSSSSHSFASSSMYGDDVDGAASAAASGADDSADKEELSHMQTELNATRRQCREEQQRVNDLEDQMTSLSECLLANCPPAAAKLTIVFGAHPQSRRTSRWPTASRASR